MRILIITLIYFGSVNSILSQGFTFKFSTGASRYVGDLAEYSFLSNNAEAHFSYSASIGYRPTTFLTVEAKLFNGKLSGNDNLSGDPVTRRRNLRFETPLLEYGLGVEIDLNNLILGGWEQYGIHFLLNTGINLFKTNPRTALGGSIYFLQEWSTEGQGVIPGTEVYSLTNLSIPLGVSVEFRISDNINMGVEINRRFTSTDYIDDVSGAYPDLGVLAEAKGDIAALLSYRTQEITGISDVPVGELRGNPNNNDWFFYTGVYARYYLKNNPIKVKKPEDAIP